MLTSEELVIKTAQLCSPAQLQMFERTYLEQCHRTAQRAIKQHVESMVVKVYLAATGILACIGMGVSVAVDSPIPLLLALMVSIFVGLAALPIQSFWERRALEKATPVHPPFQPHTDLRTDLKTDGGQSRLITVADIEHQHIVLEDIPVDIDAETSVAQAARVQARNEQAIPQLHKWREQPMQLTPPQQPAPRDEYTQTINGILNSHRAIEQSTTHQ